jgi:hypothetical protein
MFSPCWINMLQIPEPITPIFASGLSNPIPTPTTNWNWPDSSEIEP